MNTQTIERIDALIASAGAGTWEQQHETTLYLSQSARAQKGYDCITYYRGGYGYPELCFVKERIEGNNYGACRVRVDYATPEDFLAELKTQTYWGGTWRDTEQMERIKTIWN